MGETLFISDLHLDAKRPRIVALFLRFLAQEAPRADALYILGDLFEYWIGDDMLTHPATAAQLAPLADALAALSAQGLPVHFQHGNRDFLIGEDFARRCGVKLLPEAVVVDLYGTPTLIMHGDTLCTDDVAYQELRGMLRNAQWQQQFLALPFEERVRQAQALRERSAQAMEDKQEYIMDVNAEAVQQALRTHGVTRLVHGHTHRPAVHELSVDGVPAQRIVLGDWYEQGSLLRCSASGCRLESLG